MKQAHPDDLNALAMKALNGDEQAMSDLLDALFPKLVEFVQRRAEGKDRAICEDIAQETLMKTMSAIRGGSFNPESGRIDSFATLIAARLLIDYWRKRNGTVQRAVAGPNQNDEAGSRPPQVRAGLPHPTQAVSIHVGDEHEPVPTAYEPSPSDTADLQEQIAALRDCLGRFNREDYELIRKRYDEALSLEAISRGMGLPLTTVNDRLRRLMDRMRTYLRHRGMN